MGLTALLTLRAILLQIRGTYMLSNLLQELALARDHGQKSIVLDEARLSENPVSRLSRMIRNMFWSNLTRRIDGDGLEAICADPKVCRRVSRTDVLALTCAVIPALEPRKKSGPQDLRARGRARDEAILRAHRAAKASPGTDC